MSDSALRSQRRQWAAPGSGHDRLIGLLQFILPVGVGVLAAFLVMAPLFARGEMSFVLDKNKVDMASERMKMEGARYTGQDARGRAFALDAGSAVQKTSSDPIVDLERLAARIELRDGPANIRADQGRYDMTKQQVKVDGPIAVTAADGYRMTTQDATVDLKTRRVESAGAVSGSTPLGTFRGDTLAADLDARTVALRGNARLRVMPGRAKGAP
jgi:lipopolysaccharide export system protein LptC